MARKKITVVGAGNVGASLAQALALTNLADVVLIDIPQTGGMPAGKGMIHRAAIMAGGGGNIPTIEQSREFSRRLVRELGIGAKDIAALQKMDWKTLFETGNKVATEINGPFRRGFGPPVDGPPRVGWAPTLDGRPITMRSFTDAAPDISRDIPILIGSNSEDGTSWSQNPTEAEWRASLAEQLGCEFDEGPAGRFIRTGADKQTTVSGVYAAGDAARPGHNASWATADGVTAGISAHQSLSLRQPACR